MKKLFLILFLLPLFISGQTLNLNNNQVELGGDTAVVVNGNLKADTIFGVVPLPYKVYTALLTQTNTNAPTAIVIENTLGVNVSWQYSSPGYYFAVLTVSYQTLNKTALIGSCYSNRADEIFCYWSYNELTVETQRGVEPTDGILENTTIEIRIYP